MTLKENKEFVYSVEEIKKRLEPIFRAKNTKKAVLFGSYAQKSATPNSDIDIIVDSGLRGLKFFGLVGAIQSALGKDVDVIDVYSIDKDSPIEQEARRTGVAIYERQ